MSLDSLRGALVYEIAAYGALVAMDREENTAPALPKETVSPGPDGEETPFTTAMNALVPSESPLASLASLEEIHDYVASTVLLPIDRTRTCAVPGHGNPNAALVIIGEAPGADEDQQGKPFVGRAGRLLTKILTAINIVREDVFVTNILKSRPPQNRNPMPAEMAAHLPILYRQLALIRPRILLCLGKIAGNGLLNTRVSLGNMRGKFHDFHGIPCMVTYHPAALLRNPQWKRPAWEDVQKLRARYDAILNV